MMFKYRLVYHDEESNFIAEGYVSSDTFNGAMDSVKEFYDFEFSTSSVMDFELQAIGDNLCEVSVSEL